jgi:hypothetical protein
MRSAQSALSILNIISHQARLPGNLTSISHGRATEEFDMSQPGIWLCQLSHEVPPSLNWIALVKAADDVRRMKREYAA